jgi:replication-associated recombination protein RarA
MFKKYNSSLNSMIFNDPFIKQSICTEAAMGISKHLLISGSNGIGKSLIAGLLVTAANPNSNPAWHFLYGFNLCIEEIKYTLNLLLMTSGSPAVVVIDEVDRMKAQERDMLQGLIDDFTNKNVSSCKFILTTNRPVALSNALRSRLKSYPIAGLTALQCLPMVASEFQKYGVLLTDSDIINYLTTCYEPNAILLDIRKVEEMVKEVVFRMANVII